MRARVGRTVAVGWSGSRRRPLGRRIPARGRPPDAPDGAADRDRDPAAPRARTGTGPRTTAAPEPASMSPGCRRCPGSPCSRPCGWTARSTPRLSSSTESRRRHGAGHRVRLEARTGRCGGSTSASPPAASGSAATSIRWHHRHARIRPLDRLGIRLARVPRARAPRACRTGPAHRSRALAGERRPAGRVPGRDAGAGRADVAREPGMGAVRRAVRRLRRATGRVVGIRSRKRDTDQLTRCRPLGRPASGHRPGPSLTPPAGCSWPSVTARPVSVTRMTTATRFSRSDPDRRSSRTRFRRRPGRPTTTRDLDLGSQGPALVGAEWVFSAGKSGTGYVLRRSLWRIGGQVSQAEMCRSFGGTAVAAGSSTFRAPMGSARCHRTATGSHPCCGTPTATRRLAGDRWGPRVDPRPERRRAACARPGDRAYPRGGGGGETSRFATPATAAGGVLVPTLAGLTVVRTT